MFLLVCVFFFFSCGSDKNETIEETEDSFTDGRDNKTYKTVTIGTQTWMAENLAYISSETLNNGAWVYDYTGSDIDAAKATNNYTTYGALYNWTTAQNVCPDGWHLPSNSEWITLEQFISNEHGGYQTGGDEYPFIQHVGNHLKSKTGWSENRNGTDDYGFTARPNGGRHYETGEFMMMGEDANFFTSTNDGNQVLYKCIHHNLSNLHTYKQPKTWAHNAIRCIKD